MTIYYQDEHVTLYHGDCREVMAGMADQSVKAVITDPPYTERTHTKARSSLAAKKSMTLANGVGVIDAGFRDEIKVPVIPLDGCHNLIQAGQKIAQLIILPIALPTVEVVAELPESARGLGGFGSTGH